MMETQNDRPDSYPLSNTYVCTFPSTMIYNTTRLSVPPAAKMGTGYDPNVKYDVHSINQFVRCIYLEYWASK